MSEPVLEGLRGVELINSDYYNGMERNIVWFDPALISIDEMENALKESGTYLGTDKETEKQSEMFFDSN